MPKSKAKLKRKYEERFATLKKDYDIVCQKNLKHIEVNDLYHLAEQKWRKQNSYLLKENSLDVTKVMQLRKSLKDKENEVIDLKKEIEYLREQLRRKEMEEIERMKEEIPNDF